MPEPRRPARMGSARFTLAVLVCVVWLFAYLAVSVVLYIHCLRPAQDWIDVQGWWLRNLGGIVLWLAYFVIACFGWAMTQGIWKAIAGGNESGGTSANGNPGSCPSCKVSDGWDGQKCTLCGYTHGRWRKGSVSNA